MPGNGNSETWQLTPETSGGSSYTLGRAGLDSDTHCDQCLRSLTSQFKDFADIVSENVPAARNWTILPRTPESIPLAGPASNAPSLWKTSPRVCSALLLGCPGIDDGQLVGCDKQRAGTPNHRHGVPALPLVTPYKFTNWPAAILRARQLSNS